MQNYSNFSEEELLSLLVSGNRLAFKQLYVLNFRKIYAYALKFTKSTDLAEDITQDVFIKVWEGRENLHDVRHFRSYLFTICKNLTLNILVRAAKEIKIRGQILAGAQKFHVDTENKIQSAEYDMLLNKAIEHLPPQRQLIFKLCKIEGKSYEEVATQLGITSGTVNDHIVKATRSIRDYLLRYDITLAYLIIFYFSSL